MVKKHKAQMYEETLKMCKMKSINAGVKCQILKTHFRYEFSGDCRKFMIVQRWIVKTLEV